MGIIDSARLKDNVVLIEGLTKKYKERTVVDNLNLNVKKGEIFGLVGSDGAGKTTTIQMLCGILSSNAGVMFIDGHNVEKEPDVIRSRIGYMSQDFTLYLDLTVEENIDFMADLRGIKTEQREKQKEILLNFSRMAPFRNRRAADLSGGMKKKLALSCALIHRPKILILDEPTTAVDPLSRSELWKILYEFLFEGITILISTPYMDEAERCHRVAMVQEGKIITCDTPSNLKGLITRKIASFHTNNISKACSVLKNELLISGQVFGDRINVFLDDPDLEMPKIANDMARRDIILDDWEEVLPTMDDVFLSFLQKDLKKNEAIKNLSFNFHGNQKKPVVVSSICKHFGDFVAVNNVSFEIEPGSVFGLLGPNGAGKTTTIKMLCGLIVPTQGEAFVAGYSIKTQQRLVKSRIGYMSQLFSLYPDLTVQQNLDFFGSIYGLPKKEKMKKIDWVLDLAGLKGKEKYLTSELAGGWKQKLALGCAVMHQPEVLFLDEPTSGVDPIGRIEFWDAIYAFSEAGITTVVTTHFMDEAEHCNILGLMTDGNLVAMGSPGALKEDLSVNFYEITTSLILETYNQLMGSNLIFQMALFGDKIHVLIDKKTGEMTKKRLEDEGIKLDGIEKIMPTLDDVFIYHIKAGEQN